MPNDKPCGIQLSWQLELKYADGESNFVNFSGPHAKQLASDYTDWLNASHKELVEDTKEVGQHCYRCKSANLMTDVSGWSCMDCGFFTSNPTVPECPKCGYKRDNANT